MSLVELRQQIEDKVYCNVTTKLPCIDQKSQCITNIGTIVLSEREKLHSIYRFVPADSYNILSILNENIFLMPASSMNDEYEGLVQSNICSSVPFRNRLLEFRRSTLLKSFSECPNSTYMWENYADSHKGMRITYDFSKLDNNILKHFYPVQYTNEHFTCQKPMELQNTPYLYLRKTRKWKEEQEWRFVYLDNVERTIPLTDCIKEVCFGIRMDDLYRDSIISAVHRIHSNIRFSQATVSSKDLSKDKR